MSSSKNYQKLDTSKYQLIHIESGEIISNLSDYSISKRKSDNLRKDLNSQHYFRINLKFLKGLIENQIEPKTLGVLILMLQHLEFENNALYCKKKQDFHTKISLGQSLGIDRKTLDKHLNILESKQVLKIYTFKNKKILAISPYFAWKKYNESTEKVHTFFNNVFINKLCDFNNAILIDIENLNTFFTKKTIVDLAFLFYLIIDFNKGDNSIKRDIQNNRLYTIMNKRCPYFTKNKVKECLEFIKSKNLILENNDRYFIHPCFIRNRKDCDLNTFNLFGSDYKSIKPNDEF